MGISPFFKDILSTKKYVGGTWSQLNFSHKSHDDLPFFCFFSISNSIFYLYGKFKKNRTTKLIVGQPH